MVELPGPAVVALEPDLFFGARIADLVHAEGAHAELVETSAALWQAIMRYPVLVLIDLSADTGWQETVRRAKNLPHTRPIPIIAFGSHVDTALLREAHQTGCDEVWIRSRFMTELPALLQRTLRVPVRESAACGAPPPPLLLKGVDQFNRGEYWACHETLEELWRTETDPVRELYQGILQVGVGFHHLRRHNYAGALKVLRRGLPRLAGFPDVCQGIRVGDLALAVRAVQDRIVARGSEHIADFDLEALPRVEVIGDAAP